MTKETTTPPPTKAKPSAHLDTATSLLFRIAARSHSLAEVFGVEQISTSREGEEPDLKFYSTSRPWLDPHPRDPQELSFNPMKFARQMDVCSDGQRHMIRFILNVWNSGLAKEKKWNFDLFQALSTLDEGNRQAIVWWLERPIWP